MTILSDKVRELEESNARWSNLCREIMTTITLEANQDYFSKLPENWHNIVSAWKDRYQYAESAQQRLAEGLAGIRPIDDVARQIVEAELRLEPWRSTPPASKA